MEIIDILLEASRQVYDRVKDMSGTPDAAKDGFGIGAGGDVSRKIDIVAENTVLEYFKKVNFGCTVLGEECGRVELSDNPTGFVIMDAIDGSSNAVNGIKFFSCSLAFATSYDMSSITDAVVTDLSSGDLYSASKNKGAFLNGEKICSNKQNVYKIIGINLSNANTETILQLQPILKNYSNTRQFGSNALEMAFLACGLIDAYIDFREKLRVIDVAAGYLLVKEAGGIILNSKLKQLQSDLSYSSRISFVAASNNNILDEIVSQIKT